ncbi:MAG: ABC-2 type transport system permease protein [Neolewinella sp.]|jgi:ABC-type Na+ efflux pump permease subunit
MWNIFLKDFSILLNDRKAVIMKFALPIVMISIFVMAFAGMRSDGKGGEIRQVRLPIVDQDSSFASKYVVSFLESSPTLRLEPVDYELGEKVVQDGRRAGILVIEKGFGEAYANGTDLPWELLYQEGREMEMSILQSILVPQLEALRENQSSTTSGPVTRFIDTSGAMPVTSRKGGFAIRAIEPDEARRNDPWLVQPVAGIAIILLLFNVTGLAGSILEEKESGTLPRLLQALPSPAAFFGAKFLLGALISSIQLTIMFLFAKWVFGLDLSLSPALLVVVLVSLVFTCSAFGLLLASWSRTRAQMQGLSITSILLMSAIGGSMIPLFIMPEFMQTFAKLSINYWGLEAIYDILWRQTDSTVVLQKVGVLLLMGVGFLGLGWYFFKRNLRRYLG